MPEPVDPANARLALRRLIRSLLASDAAGPTLIDTWEGAEGQLDADELADYEQVATALAGVEPQRFAVIDLLGWHVLDLAECMTPHGSGRVKSVAEFPGQVNAQAAAKILNAHADEWDRHEQEPF